MEAVRAFNSELSSLYEGKPPISRAKMASVTKCAIKAIKFYKHVVQSVEKFIQKCKAEYKVPGLYVIDSIVRQSRHQFGPEKDVFSPRFTKNIVTTFTHLLKCPVEERSRLVRVLNLWQKNSVFPVEVIQPLLDLAADPNNTDLVAAAQKSVEAVVSVTQKVPLPGAATGASNGGDAGANQLMQSEMLNTITKLLQQAQDGSMTGLAPESQLQQLQHLQQQLVMQTERISKPHAAATNQGTPAIDSNLLAQIQMLTNQLLSKSDDGQPSVKGSGDGGMQAQQGQMQQKTEPLFNKKLLDFDYGDSDEDDDRQDYHHQHQQHQLNRPPPNMMQQGGPPPGMNQDGGMFQQHQIQQMNQQQEQLQSEIGAQEQLRRRLLEQQQQQFDREIGQAAMIGQQNFNNDMDRDRDDEDDRDSRDRRRRGSRDRSRSPRRRSRRSRSRSRDKRRRSRSRDKRRRSRSRDRERRERERERRKQGLPDIKENHVSICTTTLWFGRLTKHTTEEELREHIEKYGTIKTINMIPPRGCAFVCLTKRKDAFKALDRLKGVKVNGSSIKVAWAPGIGVKESVYKEYWDVDQGATYIPWDRLPMDITQFVNGGMLDDETLPDRLKGVKTGEEDGDGQQQQDMQQQQQPPPQPNMEGGIPPMMDNQMPPHMQMNMPGQGPNFPMPGAGPMNMMNPGGPMGMMGMRPPMGMGGPNDGMNMGNMNNMPGGGPMGGPMNMGGGQMNMNMPPPNMPGMNNMNRPPPNSMGGGMPPGFGGIRPGMQAMGMRPGQMNFRPQGMMMGGPGGPGNSTSPGAADMQRMNNSTSPRGQFNPQFGNNFMQPRMQQPDNMPRQPFFNNGDSDSRGDNEGQGDGGMAEPKEWPPDDEVNDEDQQDDPDMLMDSDERMLPPRGPQQQPPRLAGPGGLPANLRTLGNLFGPMMASQRAPMLGLPHSQAAAAQSVQQSILSLRMMTAAQGPPQPQMLAMAGAPGGPPRFAMTAGGMRVALPPSVGVRPAGMVPGSPSPRMLAPGNPLPVAVSGGNVMVSRPGGMPPIPSPGLPMGLGAKPPGPNASPEQDEDGDESRLGGPGMPMMMQGGNRPPPGGPILGRGFAPMTIRPRGGPSLLGLGPGGGGNNFNRFGAPRPMLRGGGFRMERPMFRGRFGAPIRPPVAFFDQDDKDERRLPLLDDPPGPPDVDERSNERSQSADVDERANRGRQENGDKDERQDKDERPPRVSRWGAAAEPTSQSVPVVVGGSGTVENSDSNAQDKAPEVVPAAVEASSAPPEAPASVVSEPAEVVAAPPLPAVVEQSSAPVVEAEPDNAGQQPPSGEALESIGAGSAPAVEESVVGGGDSQPEESKPDGESAQEGADS